jgi:hypothetical protein
MLEGLLNELTLIWMSLWLIMWTWMMLILKMCLWDMGSILDNNKIVSM